MSVTRQSVPPVQEDWVKEAEKVDAEKTGPEARGQRARRPNSRVTGLEWLQLGISEPM